MAKALRPAHQFRTQLGLDSARLCPPRGRREADANACSPPLGYTPSRYPVQRTADVASARLCCIEGIPMKDVVTLRMVRRRFWIASAPGTCKDPSKRAASSPAKSLTSGVGVQGFCTRIEDMILHSILWRWRNGASHRKNFDTPPLRGCCRASRGAPERYVRNE